MMSIRGTSIALTAAAALAATFAAPAASQSPKHPAMHRNTSNVARCAAWRGKIATGGSTTTAATGVAPNSQTPPLAQQQAQATSPNGATITTNGKTTTTTINRGTVATQTRTCAGATPSPRPKTTP